MNQDNFAQKLTKAINALKARQFDQSAKISRDIISKLDSGDIAEQAGKIYTQLQPNDFWGFNAYGLVLFANKKLPEAGKQFAKAVNLKVDYAEAWGNYANVLHQLGLLKEAEEFTLKALETANDKQKVSIRLNYINILIHLEKYQQAKEIVRKIPISLSEHSSSYNITLGILYSYLDNPECSIQYFHKALSIDPDNKIGQKNLANLYTDQRQYDKAYDIWKRIITNSRFSEPEIEHFMAVIRSYNNTPAKNELILEKSSLNKIGADLPEVKIDEVNDLYQLITLEGFKVYPDSWEIFNDHLLYMDMSFHKQIGDGGFMNEMNSRPKNITKPIENTQQLEGQYLLLAGCDNYYHWIVDYLPRLEALEQHPQYKELKFLMNSNITGYQKASLEAIGFDIDRIVATEKAQVYEIEELIIPHMTNRFFTDGYVPDWMRCCATTQNLGWLRESYKDFMKPRNDLPKRIFLSRAGAKFRRCVNEEAVLKLAKDYGFEIVANENLSFTDQIALYSGIEAVMGPHGAGFTNTVFSSPGTHVIEMFPGSHAPEFYKVTSDLMGHHHHSINGDIVHAMKPLGPEFWDFEVDLEHIKHALEQV